MKEMFPGIWKEGKRWFTKNMVPGARVYGEKLLPADGGTEFREWTPERSKLAAALANNLREVPFGPATTVLYLGASTGTTVSHVSDLCPQGRIYAIEFAERVFHNLLQLASQRQNIIPLMADARKTELYRWIELVDVVFVDISQPEETDIALRNAELFLRPGGILMIAIKSQSIDVTKKSHDVYKEERAKVATVMDVLSVIDLEPYEKNHAMIVARKK